MKLIFVLSTVIVFILNLNLATAGVLDDLLEEVEKSVEELSDTGDVKKNKLDKVDKTGDTCPNSPKVYKEGGNPEWDNCTGTLTWDGGSITGKFIKGVLPYATITFANGDKYVGEFKDESFHGQGTFTYEDGEYVGEFKDNKKHGQGTYTFADDGTKYVGEWKDDDYNGQGTFYNSDGTIAVAGLWKDGKPQADTNAEASEGLSTYYFMYKYVKRCNELGNMYIDDKNMKSAKKYIKAIEIGILDHFKANDLDTDSVWKKTTKKFNNEVGGLFDIIEDQPNAPYDANMYEGCSLYYSRLSSVYKQITPQQEEEKDF